MQDRKASQEEIETGFRKALEDVVPIIQRLAPGCRNLEELTSMLELAQVNDGQLRMLMERVLSKDGPRR